MALAVFNGVDGLEIYVNPDNVVSVSAYGDQTWIRTTAQNAGGTPFVIVVKEDAREVAQRLFQSKRTFSM